MFHVTLMGLVTASTFLMGASHPAGIPDGRPFPSAEAAAQALAGAAITDDVNGLIEILGPTAKEIFSVNEFADRKIRHDFAARAVQRMKLATCPGRRHAKILLTGRDEWPLPFPIVEIGGNWYFDIVHSSDQRDTPQ